MKRLVKREDEKREDEKREDGKIGSWEAGKPGKQK